jgi:outer membrane protein OmpA-like peptidoglycan-associated protein
MNKFKKYQLVSILIFSVICTFSVDLFAWDEDACKKLIEKADNAIGEIDNNFEIQEFLPFDYYTKAVINIRNSRKQVEDEEYELAFFHVSIALIKIETARIYAEAKKLDRDRLLFERNYYRNKKKAIEEKPVKTTTDLNEIIEANLLKKGNIYRIEILDRNLFEKRRLRLSKRGMKSMEKIIRVLDKFENSKIRIVGHTSFYDYKKFSERKSKRLKKFFVANNIKGERIDSIGAGNRIVMNTAVGFRRIDRVEFIITGIE